jgi:hypothetical protein
LHANIFWIKEALEEHHLGIGSLLDAMLFLMRWYCIVLVFSCYLA